MCRQLQSCEATCGADARHHISHFEHFVTSDRRCDHKTIFTAVRDWCLRGAVQPDGGLVPPHRGPHQRVRLRRRGAGGEL